MIKEVTITRFVAFDGSEHVTRELAEDHELKNPQNRLANLSPQEISAAISREDPDLADVFERVGRMCAEKRRAFGDLRRITKARRDAMESAQAPEAAQ